ncbi:Pheromone P-factor receptor [Schizosaccharomyces pombe]|uniref:Pheromone P-factor receptor n=1 Tax=Schizosaccharomyces pombe (strain 972 / ATCC 24843) TaxID=284812 RepID=MAM2_SCHPO|nr:pheromone p-factor receptor [Schizosaccharomyces pombe]Q00619.1 RecName: Full=Pheromone P-factor receptor [Schizosaccharomyces pombe 972h-]CAA43846.1 pheromone receptor [Schizosaccharomyces pombe]CAB59800.1 pheromone p-factor receptor [Schizosaccharomyces pombe]|eukprot:NP_594722.1 pheromone p-factor receptor [Schizosaccharomyces pombe]
MRQPWWKDFTIPDASAIIHQNITIVSIVGEIEVPVSTIDAYERDRLLTGMTLSAQLALGVLTILMVCLLSSSEKRKHPVFVFNSASIVAMCLRAILNIVTICSNSYSILVNYGFILNMVHMYVHVFNILILLLAPVIIFTAEMSMMIQVRIICAHDRKTQRIMTVISACLTVLVLAFWITNMCQQIQYLLWLTPLSSKTIVGYSWPYFIAKILFAFSIIFHSGVFSYKLFRAILIRKKIGQFPFGPMQCILVISCQCLIVPATFTIIDSFIHTYDGFSSMTQCLLIISLPLSSLWASSTALKLQSMKTSSAQGETTEVSIRVDRTFDIKHTPSDDYSISDESETKKWT